MQFEIELYVSEKTREEMCFICASDGASGAEYPVNNIREVADAVAFYLENYYPECMEVSDK